jgi:autotransporter-associated beta strand protein
MIPDFNEKVARIRSGFIRGQSVMTISSRISAVETRAGDASLGLLWGLRKALLASVMTLAGAAMYFAVIPSSALAQAVGGAGGNIDQGALGNIEGAGGTGSSPQGGDGTASQGGGGGGGGGVSVTTGSGGAGGTGGASPDGGGIGGNGGAGGSYALVNPGAIAASATGIAGSDGLAATPVLPSTSVNSGGGGGGGGAGGGGILETTPGTSLSIGSSISIRGGAGGTGGTGGTSSENAGGDGGGGGGGGDGIDATGGTVTITNAGTIGGGNGGAGGAGGTDPSNVNKNGANGAAGAGGIGILGSSLTITNTGSISGGLANGGAGAQADAISFTGGANNSLTLSSGGTVGTLNGGIGISGFLAIDPGTTAGNNVTLSNVIHDGSNGAGNVTKVGAGTLTLSGASTYTGGTTVQGGTLQLSGAGTLGAATGFLAVSAGTLDLGSKSLTSGALTVTGGTVQNGTLSSSSYGVQAGTISAVLAGGGALTKTGSGSVTLSGANTYAGGTTISAGGLLLGNNSALGTGALAVTGNATLDGIAALSLANNINLNAGDSLALLGGQPLTLGGVISGGGSLIKDGASTLTLTGADLFSGGLFINAGTLALGAGGSLAANVVVNLASLANFDISAGGTQTIGSLAGVAGATVALGANTLTLDGGGNSSFGGSIGGTGSLVKDGSGTQTLTGANGFIGSTTVNGGTLEIGSGGSITQSASLTNSANFTVDSGGSATFGSVTNNAGGTITNNGTITDDLNNAGTVTNNGTYVANVASNTGTITNNSIWTGTIITSGTFANTTGATVSGLVTNSGTGSNAGTLSGGLTNTAGTFNNTGTIGGTTTVSGGTLFGTGSTGTLNITNGGAFAPGNGTPGSSATVNGSLAFSSGAFYQVAINPQTASFTNVTGSATLGGASVQAFFSSGSYVTKQYTIVNATGGVVGTFAALANTNLPSGFTATLSTDATHAYLNLALNFTPPPVTPPSAPSAPVNSGLNINQRNVGNALVNSFNTVGTIPIVFGALTPAGLTQASGELPTASQQTTFDAMNLFMGLMTDPFVAGRGDGPSAGGGAAGYADEASAYAAKRKPSDALAAIYTKAPPVQTFEQRWSTWIAGYGGSQTTDGNAVLGSNNTTSSVYGTAVGADYLFSPNTIAGFALAGGGTAFSVNGSGSGHSDLFQAGAFIRHDVGPLYISAALAYGWQDITTNRTVTVAGADQLHAEFNANAFSGRVESGYRFVAPWTGGVGITPYAAGQFTTFDLPAYAESVLSGAGTFALAYGAKDVTDTRSELGFRTDKSFAVQDGILTLRTRFAWAYDFDPDRSIAATFQALPGASFVVNGAAQASDSALTTASIEMKWKNGWSAAAAFEGEFSNVTSSYAGKGVVRYAW